MPNPTLDDIVDNYETPCCKAETDRIGKHEYRCKKCGDDVTYDFYIIVKLQVD